LLEQYVRIIINENLLFDDFHRVFYNIRTNRYLCEMSVRRERIY